MTATPGMSEELKRFAAIRERMDSGVLAPADVATLFDSLYIARKLINEEREKIKEKDSELAARIQQSNNWAEAATKANEALESSRQEIDELKNFLNIKEGLIEYAEKKLEAERQSTREGLDIFQRYMHHDFDCSVVSQNKKYGPCDCGYLETLARHKAGGKAT